ncbi:hypothetical protein Tco_0021919 [Tanacetum coccineum]
MGDEHLDTIPATKSNEVIKSSVEILVPILSEFKGIFDDTCDESVCDDSSTFDALNDNPEILSDSNDDDTSSDDDSFENIEYVDASPSYIKVDFDPSFPHPPPEPPDVEIYLHFEPDVPVIDKFNKLNDDQRESEIIFLQNVEDDDSFAFVIRIFLPFLTYSEASPLSCSTGSEDIFFDPGIVTFHFSYLKPLAFSMEVSCFKYCSP